MGVKLVKLACVWDASFTDMRVTTSTHYFHLSDSGIDLV